MKTTGEAIHGGSRGPSATIILGALAGLRIALVLPFIERYGYFRDELYYIACSKHLAWGFVDQPPFSLAVLAANRAVLGDSLLALRWIPVLAGAATVFLAGLIARKLGAGRFGQALAALAVVFCPVLLGSTRYFSMNALDILLWAAASYVLAAILAEGRPRLWPLFGVITGLGLLNKYSMGFFLAGVLIGLVLTSRRKHLRQPAFWVGMAVAGILFLPHVLWEARHGFPSFEFMRNATLYKNVPLSLPGMLIGLFMEGGFVQAGLWIVGLYFFLLRREAAPFRPFGWMFLAVFAITVLGHGKPYYMGSSLTVMFAGGAVLIEAIAAKRRMRWTRIALPAVMAAFGILVLPFAVPALPVETFIGYAKSLGVQPRADERSGVGDLPQHYADMFGWEEMVRMFADASEKLTPEERSNFLIYVRNYGEAGAIDFFGPRYGLPPASCGHNSYWYWGPPRWDGKVALIVGVSNDLQECLDDLQPSYASIELAAIIYHPHAIPHENGRMVFICRGFKHQMNRDLWARERDFM
jgi:hypothetical protein